MTKVKLGSLASLETEVSLVTKVNLVPAGKESLAHPDKLVVSVKLVQKEKPDISVSSVCPVLKENVVNKDLKV